MYPDRITKSKSISQDVIFELTLLALACLHIIYGLISISMWIMLAILFFITVISQHFKFSIEGCIKYWWLFTIWEIIGVVYTNDMTYAIGDQQITITSGELITLAKSLNTLFAKLQVLVDQFAYEQGKSDHPYYRRLLRYTFTDFNKVYESSVLSIIGKAMFPF